MDDSTPRMKNLFLQLGLDESDAAIAAFIEAHQLPAAVKITEAPFWTEAQRQFLSEQFKADALWVTVVDQLNEALHADAMQAAPGHRGR